MKHVPNIISICRIVLSLSLLLFINQPFLFFALYLICGISDIADGALARMLNSKSRLGAKLDSIGDFFLFMVILIYCSIVFGKDFVPYVPFLIIVIAVRVGAILFAAFKYHSFVMLHTWSNKITGLLAFFAPILLMLANPMIIKLVLGIALLAALEEFILHVISKTPDLDKRGLL